MSAKLQKLLFSVSLLDRVSGPAGKLKKSLGSVAHESKKAFSNIGMGAAGIAGAGYSLKAMLNPAIEMDRALGEVKSLGVTRDALDHLSATALQFSSTYGKSAADFVRSSYDIQSAISGLTGSELSAFTRSSGILAAATKADTATITDYMGTLYGVFGDQAAAMGKAEWVQQVAGQTATAVQMFKTDGAKMSQAFSALGASAASAGRDLAEQMAIMGTLQATMSGSESATKYKAFLAGVGKAQSALGLAFTDSNGNMLGMVDILDRIRGKFGDTLDLAESDALMKAFGSKEAVALVQQLIGKTGELGSSINKLGDISGMGSAVKMAEAMVDPWQKMGASVNGLSIALGQVLLPVLNPLIAGLASGAKTLVRWAKEFPTLTKIIGGAAVGVLALGAAFGVVSAAAGLMNLVLLANPIVLIIGGATAAIIGLIRYWDDLTHAIMNSRWIIWIKGQINRLISLLNYLPGVNIDKIGQFSGDGSTLNAPKQLNAQPGGINKQISHSWSHEKIGRSVNIGQIVTNQPAQTIEDELMMAGA